jgi:hypothetical protein
VFEEHSASIFMSDSRTAEYCNPEDHNITKLVKILIVKIKINIIPDTNKC